MRRAGAVRAGAYRPGENLWVMHKEVGITLECTDLMCLMPEQRCPFEAPFN